MSSVSSPSAKVKALKICFITDYGYGVLSGAEGVRIVGGAEVQQCLLATELARRGHDVSMISVDFGQAEGERIEGVKSIKSHPLKAGIPGLRFLHPRLTGLWSAMKRADADIYYKRGAGSAIAIAGLFARRHGRHLVFGSSSDTDFDPSLPRIPGARDRWLYRRGLPYADAIVAQNERQVSDCRKHFGRDAAHINSCYGHQGQPAEFDGVVLWAGNLRTVKRPELFLDLAQRLPQFRFRMVGAGDFHSAGRYEWLNERALKLGNVEMTGFVPFAEVERQFDGASLLVNTSSAEGFPNTFLQAWSRGMPTVSFFEPGARVGTMRVGSSVPTLDAMVERVRQLKSDRGEWQVQGQHAAQYVRLHNSIRTVVDRYELVFDRLVRGQPDRTFEARFVRREARRTTGTNR